MFPGTKSEPCACPEGFSRCGGRCHTKSAASRGEESNYTDAESYCARLGAHPPTPRTEEENTCAAEAATAAGVDRIWLGYRGGRTEESFVAVDGSGPITYRNWNTLGDSGEPHLNADDNCVTISRYTSFWYDRPCNKTRYIVCQLENCHRPECD